MILFELKFIVCLSYLYLSFVHAEPPLFIDSLLEFVANFKRCSSKKEKYRKGSALVFVSTGPSKTHNSLFTYPFFRYLKGSCFILVFLWASTAKAQVFYPIFYPEKELLATYQHAKTPAEQMDAAGVLAQHYKSKFEDSLSSVYLHLVYNLARATNDQKLTAKALWWDAHISAGITAYDETKQAVSKTNALLHFAAQNSLTPEAIAANLLLTDIHIQKNLKLSEQYALNAKQLLNNWNIDSTKKDSLKLEVYYRLAYVSIQKKEGENAAQYLLEQQKYAEQNRNEALKIQAINNLAQLYLRWPGQEENYTQWVTTLYNYYKKTGQKNRLFIAAYILADAHLNISDTAMAIQYLNEAEQLQEDLKIYNTYMY